MSAGQSRNLAGHLRRAALLRDGGGLTDGQLLQCFVARRDGAAFEALVRRHGPMVLGVCRRVLGHAQDAEDAFQATFLILVRKAASLRRPELLGNWLYGVAYRTARDARAAAARRRVRERQVSTMPEPEVVDAGDVGRELGPALDRELTRLPDKYRVPVVLCDLEGRTRRDVARHLGLPVGTLSGRLTTARRMLARRLARQGLALSGAALAAALGQGAAAAGVPPRLVASTAEAAAAVAAGQAAAGAVSAGAAALLERGLRTMPLKKLAVAVAALVLGVVVVAGVGLLLPRAEGERHGGGRQTAGVRVLKLAARGRRVAWSPDGKTLAVVTKTESLFSRKGSAIQLWDVAKGKVRATLAESKEGGLAFQQVAFSPDGKTIAATVAEEVVLPNVLIFRSVVKLWDAKTLALKRTLGNNDSQLHFVTFSPGGRLLAACDPTHKEVTLWDARTGGLRRTLRTGEYQPWSAAFAPDGATLAVGGQKGDGSGAVMLWKVQTGNAKHILPHPAFVTAVAFSPDGKLVASGHGGGAVEVWGVAKGERVATLKGDAHAPRALTFVSSRVVAAGGSDGKVRLWDVATGKLRETLHGHTDAVYALACSGDGRTLASVSQDETLRLWPVRQRRAGPRKGP